MKVEYIMDLFDYVRQNTMKNESPLASRIRPETLDEVVGQQHIIGKDKLLYRAIQADKISPIIFYGPPGTGKTQTILNIDEIFIEDFISKSGADWNFDQHKIIDTKPSLQDFKKTVSDYLAWEVSSLLKNDNSDSLGK